MAESIISGRGPYGKVLTAKDLAGREESRTNFEQRFWSKVAIGGPEECWEWQASRLPRGYGRITISVEGKSVYLYAHRVAYTLEVGPIHRGMCILHRCDNPPCCNPKHLRRGSQADNMADRDDKGRHWTPKGESHCNSVLTERAVKRIRIAHASGTRSMRSLAREYGVTHHTVSSLLRGDTWKEEK